MSLAESIALVELLQKWRSGDDLTPMQDPAKITEAIDNVIKAAKAAQKLFAQEATKPTKK